MLPDRLYRIRDAADLLALRPSTIYRLIATNAIEVVRPTSRAVRISEQELVRIQRSGLRPRCGALSADANMQSDIASEVMRGIG
jgi:excisionase family DNA binding protein